MTREERLELKEHIAMRAAAEKIEEGISSWVLAHTEPFSLQSLWEEMTQEGSVFARHPILIRLQNMMRSKVRILIGAGEIITEDGMEPSVWCSDTQMLKVL